MPPTRVPRCGALVVVVAVLAHPVPRPRRACRAAARARDEGAVAVCPRRACGVVAACSRRECRAVAPATRVPPCPRRASGAPDGVAAHEPSVPRLRRGRVPASAPASGVRVVDVPAPHEPRLRRRSRALAPRAVCSRPSSGVRGARAPRAVCSSSECRAPAERAALVVRVPCARVEGAVVAAPPSSVPRPRRACRRARVECAALWRPRRECRRARAQSAAAVCLRRGSRRARAGGAAARALAPSAAVPSTRERYAGAVGAVSEWWTCLRRACRTDR